MNLKHLAAISNMTNITGLTVSTHKVTKMIIILVKSVLAFENDTWLISLISIAFRDLSCCCFRANEYIDILTRGHVITHEKKQNKTTKKKKTTTKKTR